MLVIKHSLGLGQNQGWWLWADTMTMYLKTSWMQNTFALIVDGIQDVFHFKHTYDFTFIVISISMLCATWNQNVYIVPVGCIVCMVLR